MWVSIHKLLKPAKPEAQRDVREVDRAHYRAWSAAVRFKEEAIQQEAYQCNILKYEI